MYHSYIPSDYCQILHRKNVLKAAESQVYTILISLKYRCRGLTHLFPLATPITVRRTSGTLRDVSDWLTSRGLTNNILALGLRWWLSLLPLLNIASNTIPTPITLSRSFGCVAGFDRQSISFTLARNSIRTRPMPSRLCGSLED
jgi:hypothetical protein